MVDQSEVSEGDKDTEVSHEIARETLRGWKKRCYGLSHMPMGRVLKEN